MDLDRYQSRLAQAGIKFESGLTNDEVQQLEARFKFAFPPDYRAFLTHALPISDNFVDWRNSTESAILNKMKLPFEGIRFDIEHNNFWLAEWGTRPADVQDAIAIATEAAAKAPTLVPIYAHRYIPAEPAEAGNPIFSVTQTDIIYYGRDLGEYLENEFRHAFGRAEYHITEPVKFIPFWSHLVELNG